MTTVIRNYDDLRKPMTTGERRFAERLEDYLEDDYLVWFDIPLGTKRRYTDFIILHPGRGLLFLEVKDWRIDNMRSINHDVVKLMTQQGLVSKPNPLLQARQCATHYINRLERDKALVHANGKYQGKFLGPWAYGVVLTNITRKQFNKALSEAEQEIVLPAHLVICRDEMVAGLDAEVFQMRLWQMFPYVFPEKLTLPQIERIRWHLFPEIRINHTNMDLFATEKSADIPDIVKVMDIQQETLARSLGEGHRVIHGVAGSGKTLLLGYRSLYLSQTSSKPILVLCFNVKLAGKLRGFLQEKGVGENVHIYHFHDWCKLQLKTYNVDVMSGEEPIWERQVASVIGGVDNGQIPREQYGALLIDEGHDFEADWLKLVVQMIDKENNSLLLLYDDAQSIYQRKRGLDFSLSSVGIQARGRTTILKINYRNTREILGFAYDFAKEFMQQKTADDDHIPLVEPEMAGVSGLAPTFSLLRNADEEIAYVAKCLQQWSDEGVCWKDMAVIFPANWLGEKLCKALQQQGLPGEMSRDYRTDLEQVALLTRHASKGLEFSHVVVMGLGYLRDEGQADESRLLYVAMTRARQQLKVTAHKDNVYTQRLAVINA